MSIFLNLHFDVGFDPSQPTFGITVLGLRQIDSEFLGSLCTLKFVCLCAICEGSEQLEIVNAETES